MSRTRHHSKKHWKGRKAKIWFDGGWANTSSKEWRRLMKHKKRRAALRQALHRIKADPEGNVALPLDKKPLIYYY
jgi:hypothetical protein